MTKPVAKHELTEATLISVPDPFGKPRVYSSLGHLTFAEMAARCDELPVMFWDGGGAIIVVWTDATDRVVCEERVPRDQWPLRRPKSPPGLKLTVAFGVNMQGGGGGGGGKNVLAIVAMVAIIAAGAWVSGGALAGPLGSSFAAGTIGAKVAAAAVTVAGAMAIGALSKPPTVPDFGQPDPKTPNTSLAEVNVLAPGAPLPRVLGTKKIRPPAISEPLTEYIDDDVVTEYVLGLAGPHKISKQAVLIGGKPLPEGAACEIRRGHTADRLQRLIARYGHTDHVNLQLTNFKHTGLFSEDSDLVKIGRDGDAVADLLPQWHSVFLRHASQQTGGPIDEHHVNLTFPAGLYNTVDGPDDFVVMPFRGRIRRIVANGKPGSWVNLPEFHYCRSHEGQFTVSLRFLWQKKGTRPAAPPEQADRRGGMWAYTSVRPQLLIPKTGGWDAAAYFIDPARRSPFAHVYSAKTMTTTNLLNMVGKKDRWEFYLDPNVFAAGQYELQIKRGAPQHASLWREERRLDPPFTTSELDLDVFGFFQRVGGAGFVAGDLLVPYPDGMIAEVAISSVVAVINKQPSPGKDVCAIALRLKNVGNAGAISCTASGLVPDWNGTAWVGLVATSNPAPHARYILSGTLNALSVPPSLIDADDFPALRQRCVREGYQVNAEIKGMSVPEALDLTLGCGFAGQRNAEQFGCTYERDRSDEGVVQTFTPRNMANFRISKAFPQLSDGLRCIYTDKNNDYQDSNVTVLYGTKSDTIEEVRYEGLVTNGEVVRRAKFDLNHSRLRLAEYSWTSPLEFIRCRKGDLVGVQTDVIMVKSGWGRIMSKTVNGADRITSFVLDQTLPAFRAITGQITIPQATFGVAIQKKNGDVTTHAVTVDTDRRTVTLNTPIDNTTDIAEGTLITAGSLGNEFARLIIKEIIPKDSSSAEILAFDEAPSLTKVLEARTADVADATLGAPVPSLLDFRYPQNSVYLAAA